MYENTKQHLSEDTILETEIARSIWEYGVNTWLMEIARERNHSAYTYSCSVYHVAPQGLNRTLVYSLVDSADGVFSIEPVSGVLVLERTLDRETQDSYQLRVQATDQAGQPGALASQVG